MSLFHPSNLIWSIIYACSFTKINGKIQSMLCFSSFNYELIRSLASNMSLYSKSDVHYYLPVSGMLGVSWSFKKECTLKA